jgi:hypothetical protein
VLATLVVWTATRIIGLVSGASDGAGGSFVGPVMGFGVVGLLLSVPVLAWAVLALGGRLVQALLALAAMLLLSVSVAAGDAPLWLAALPAAYVSTWAFQAIGGRVALARLEAAAARLAPADARGRAVVLPPDVEQTTVHDLLVRCGAGAVWQRSRSAGDGGRGHVLVTADQAAQLRDVARGALPEDAALEDVGGRTVLAWTGPLPRGDALVVDVARRRDPAGLLGDGLWGVSLDGRTVVTGTASLVLPVPMLNAFYWVSLTSTSEWVVGFGRGRPRVVGPGHRALHQFVGDGDRVDPQVDPEVLSALDLVWREVADRDTAIERLRSEALTGPVDLSAHRRALGELRRGGAMLLGPDAAEVLATWLERAREGRREPDPIAVARLIETLPDDEVVRHGRRIHNALNSRKLALRWQLTPDLDVAPLPRNLYRFGGRAGFGLVLDLPDLYVRVGDLVPPFRAIVRELVREMTLPDVIGHALARWDADDAGPGG